MGSTTQPPSNTAVGSGGQQPSGASVLKPATGLSGQVNFRFFALVVSSNSKIVRLIRRPLWNFFYSRVGRKVPDGRVSFMNLGYLPSPGEIGDEDVANVDDLVSTRLYDQVVGGVDLEGKSVVEVGCGYGGGCAHLAKTYPTASLLGVDLSEDLVASCIEHRRTANLRFRQGDAQELPIATGSVDAVVNVESSHCYPSRSRFFDEVARILRPGGSFLFADILVLRGRGETPDSVSALLRRSGLAIQDCLDITPNVLAAREAVWRSPAFHARVREEVESGVVPSRMLPLIHGALALPGSNSHSWMASGRTQYWQWRAVKSEVAKGA
jgi:SAM-dependent methyltransferase